LIILEVIKRGAHRPTSILYIVKFGRVEAPEDSFVLVAVEAMRRGTILQTDRETLQPALQETFVIPAEVHQLIRRIIAVSIRCMVVAEPGSRDPEDKEPDILRFRLQTELTFVRAAVEAAETPTAEVIQDATAVEAAVDGTAVLDPEPATMRRVADMPIRVPIKVRTAFSAAVAAEESTEAAQPEALRAAVLDLRDPAVLDGVLYHTREEAAEVKVAATIPEIQEAVGQAVSELETDQEQMVETAAS
jgi:hypothetical protein